MTTAVDFNITDAIEGSIDRSTWVKWKFSDLAENIVEKVIPKKSGLEHYIGLEHLDSGSLHIKRFGSTATLKGDKLKIYKGDIIFAKRNAYLKRIAIAKFDAVASAHSLVLRPKPQNVLPEFLPLFLLSETFWQRAIEISVGSLSPTINWKALAKQEFLLPPKDQQAQLAKLLWALDEVIEKGKFLFTINNGLANGFVEDVIHGRYLNTTTLTQSKIGEIPANWEIVNMEELVSVNDGAHHTPTYTTEGVPFLRVTDIQTDEIDLERVKFVSQEEHKELCKRCRPEKGDILYSKNGTIGISKIIDWDWEFSTFVSLALFKIKDPNRLDVRYLKVILDSIHISKEIRRRSKQGTITNLHLEEIRLFRIPVPPLKMQREIAKFASIIQSNKEKIFTKISESQSLQKSLINQIF